LVFSFSHFLTLSGEEEEEEEERGSRRRENMRI